MILLSASTSLTQGSTWWRQMKSPATDQKSCSASASSSVESSWCGDGEESPPDSPRRISCSSPRSRRFRIKVDGLRRRSPPGVLTVPSATGNVKFLPFIGVNTSFALSLRAWSSDTSICSNSSMSAISTSLFQIPPHTTHNQGIYLARLYDQIDVVCSKRY